jgi:hypothetical protein
LRDSTGAPGLRGKPEYQSERKQHDAFHDATAPRRPPRPLPNQCSVCAGSPDVAVSLAGCASSNTTSLINLPNGQTGFAVNCSGADAASSWASCYVQAGKACGATGYDIVSKDNDEGGTAGGSVTNVVSANVKNRSMIVRCK